VTTKRPVEPLAAAWAWPETVREPDPLGGRPQRRDGVVALVYLGAGLLLFCLMRWPP
jgi:hypothetical protein